MQTTWKYSACSLRQQIYKWKWIVTKKMRLGRWGGILSPLRRQPHANHTAPQP